MKKKFLAVILAGVMAASLAACGNSSDDTSPTDSQATEETTETPEAAETETSETADAASSGKTLVVYYSATGNTENAANMIAEATGGDLFELEPAEPYTSEDLDWTEDDSRVSVEHENPDQRDVELVSAAVENWDEYDTIYIGYPIWWGIAAWPVDGFVEANNFDGKTVVPFATAASSGLGESGELLQEAAGTGTWLEGECFRGSKTQEDIEEWIASLGL